MVKIAALGVLLAFAATVRASDEIPAPLAGAKGDPARGRALVADRQAAMCLLCHSAPIPEERAQGDLAPDLRNSARLTEGQIRQRIVDPGKANPGSIMPAYYRSDGLTRVAPALQGKTILSAQQIEDIVAWLRTLK